MNAPDSLLAFSAPSTRTSTPAQTRIGFCINATLPWLVLPAGVPAQLAIDPQLAPVPNVKPWLVGVLNLRGNLVPVFDVGRWHGLVAPTSAAHVLVISPGPAAVGLLCCEPPMLLSVHLAGTPPPGDAMAGLCSTWFSAADGAVYEFDPHAWLRRSGREVPGNLVRSAPVTTIQ